MEFKNTVGLREIRVYDLEGKLLWTSEEVEDFNLDCGRSIESSDSSLDLEPAPLFYTKAPHLVGRRATINPIDEAADSQLEEVKE